MSVPKRLISARPVPDGSPVAAGQDEGRGHASKQFHGLSGIAGAICETEVQGRTTLISWRGLTLITKLQLPLPLLLSTKPYTIHIAITISTNL